MIAHVDLDAFFAAVEQRDDPTLRGKPVIVGGSARRGVVAAASYEARVFGIKSAMPMAEALRRCPKVIVVPHRMERYSDASRGFFTILESFSPSVEGLSLDEAFLDLAGTERLFGPPVAIARAVKQRVRDELQLVASVGIAPIKFAAKIASDICKPDGLKEVDDVLGFLHPLPVSRLWGVGAATQEILLSMGLRTIGEVARYPLSALVSRLGEVTGKHLAALSHGVDARMVETDHAQVSIGHRETFEDDQEDRGELAVVLLDQADRVAARLRAGGLRARSVVLHVKYDDFREISRRTTLAVPTSDGGVIARTAIELLAKVAIEPRRGGRVRLTGVSVTNLEAKDAVGQQLMFDDGTRQKGERLGETMDKLAEKFGRGTIRRAVHISDEDEE